MKKLILILTLIFALTLCFVACEELGDNSDEGQSQNVYLNGAPYTEEPMEDSTTLVRIVDENNDELTSFFADMQDDSVENEKIIFFIAYQDVYYKNKEKWLNADGVLPQSSIFITVYCNYNLAYGEEWYKSSTDKDYKSLNAAFFDEYSHKLSVKHFELCEATPELFFVYKHSEENLSVAINEFYKDYAFLKTLSDLEYVKDIRIEYRYGVPKYWFAE